VSPLTDDPDHSWDFSYINSRSLVLMTSDPTNIDIPISQILSGLSSPCSQRLNSLATLDRSDDCRVSGSRSNGPVPFFLCAPPAAPWTKTNGLDLFSPADLTAIVLPPELLHSFFPDLEEFPSSQRPQPLSSFSSMNLFCILSFTARALLNVVPPELLLLNPQRIL
jgi:hypothetical protein